MDHFSKFSSKIYISNLFQHGFLFEFEFFLSNVAVCKKLKHNANNNEHMFSKEIVKKKIVFLQRLVETSTWSLENQKFNKT